MDRHTALMAQGSDLVGISPGEAADVCLSFMIHTISNQMIAGQTADNPKEDLESFLNRWLEANS